MDEDRSLSLLQLMADEGLVPSPEEELRRKIVIDTLNQLVLAWIKRVAHQRRLPKWQIAAASSTIITFGSYSLGVHGSESDIDALCLGPCFASMAEDFFIVLRNMLQSRPEVSDLYCIKDAKVPLMRFKYDGILLDLQYAQLGVASVPQNVDIFNPFNLGNLVETSWKSLTGVLANKRILQLVPNLENFQSALRCIRLWAKRRGVYGNLFGYFGGVHLAILVAFVCQLHPNARINVLISIFFKTFAFWPWPMPVKLQDGRYSSTADVIETQALMPIQLPCGPNEYCHSNITRGTFYKIRAEFLRGHVMTQDFLRPDFKWSSLFEPFPYSKKYAHFVKIFISASNHKEFGDWVDWVKLRFHCLLLKIEEVKGKCDSNPIEYVDNNVKEPNVVFYWGLQPGKSDFNDISSVEEDFREKLKGYQGPLGRIKLAIAQATELPKDLLFDSGSRRRTKACWRILDYSHRIPVYSRHLPHYVVGYLEVEPNGNPMGN